MTNLSSIFEAKLNRTIVNLTYSLDLKVWNETHMIIYVNFSNSLKVSREEFLDRIYLQVINLTSFISKQSGYELLYENSFVEHNVPKQFPKELIS